MTLTAKQKREIISKMGTIVRRKSLCGDIIECPLLHQIPESKCRDCEAYRRKLKVVEKPKRK